jgi:pimeloyl-ACP methyl ester carboxylesterase
MPDSHEGFTRTDEVIDGCPVTVVAPRDPSPGKRWVWRAEFFNAFPAFDNEMLRRGWYLAFMSVGNTFGCPSAMAHFDELYRELVERGFHPRPLLEGLSRGGLYVYAWAASNPDKVGAIYGDNPVCDFRSWPGGRGSGPGSPADWEELKRCYGFGSDAEALAWRGNPVDRLDPIVREGIPVVHVFGDADEAVPWEENTGLLAKRLQALGGEIHLVRKPGQGHHPHGPEDPAALAAWVIQNSRAAP